VTTFDDNKMAIGIMPALAGNEPMGYNVPGNSNFNKPSKGFKAASNGRKQ
jgi:hypothetical protein